MKKLKPGRVKWFYSRYIYCNKDEKSHSDLILLIQPAVKFCLFYPHNFFLMYFLLYIITAAPIPEPHYQLQPQDPFLTSLPASLLSCIREINFLKHHSARFHFLLKHLQQSHFSVRHSNTSPSVLLSDLSPTVLPIHLHQAPKLQSNRNPCFYSKTFLSFLSLQLCFEKWLS